MASKSTKKKTEETPAPKGPAKPLTGGQKILARSEGHTATSEADKVIQGIGRKPPEQE